jgi:hypothetical protein
MLGLVGGLGSLGVGAGYLSRYAYFRTMGAGWLVHELSLSDLAFGSAPPVFLLLTYGLVVKIMLFPARTSVAPFGRRSPSSSVAIGLAFGLIVLGIVDDIVLLNVGHARNQWSSLEEIGVMLTTLGSVVLGLAALDLARAPKTSRKSLMVTLMLGFAFSGLVLTPVLFGIIQARLHLVDPSAHFSCVQTVSDASNVCRPAVCFGQDRVYCLGGSVSEWHRVIVVIPWANVRTVFPPRGM